MPDHYEKEEKQDKKSDIYPNNGMCEDYDDLPREKVKRKDGLPTVDDLREMFGKGEPTEDDKAQGLGNFIDGILEITIKINK